MKFTKIVAIAVEGTVGQRPNQMTSLAGLGFKMEGVPSEEIINIITALMNYNDFSPLSYGNV